VDLSQQTYHSIHRWWITCYFVLQCSAAWQVSSTVTVSGWRANCRHSLCRLEPTQLCQSDEEVTAAGGNDSDSHHCQVCCLSITLQNLVLKWHNASTCNVIFPVLTLFWVFWHYLASICIQSGFFKRKNFPSVSMNSGNILLQQKIQATLLTVSELYSVVFVHHSRVRTL